MRLWRRFWAWIEKGYGVEEALKLWWNRKNKGYGAAIVFAAIIVALLLLSFILGATMFSSTKTVEVEKAIYYEDRSEIERLEKRVLDVEDTNNQLVQLVRTATQCDPTQVQFLICLDVIQQGLQVPNAGVKL